MESYDPVFTRAQIQSIDARDARSFTCNYTSVMWYITMIRGLDEELIRDCLNHRLFDELRY